MSIKDILMSKPSIATKLLESTGRKNALKTYKEALTLPAYKSFYKDVDFDFTTIKSFDDFTKIPLTDKDNFVYKYPLEDRVKFSFPENYTIERSSGYSGKPNYWPRFTGQDDATEARIITLLDMLFNLKTQKTLLINTFALGTWIAGTKVGRWMLNAANRKDMKMTVVNVGINIEESVDIIKRFYSHYDQIILLGYNPFLKELIEKLSDEKFPFKKTKVHLLMGGEGMSEEWRDYVADLMEFKIDDFDAKIISGYGAADTGSDIGVEQPIAIYFRRLLNNNKKLREQVFGKELSTVPMIFQYAPTKVWVEELDGELLFTANSGMPLVRYNLHDSGGLIKYQDMIDIVASEYKGNIKNLITKLKAMPLPLVYLYGRSDGTLQIVGLNIYIEHLKLILSKSKLQKFFTGRFYAEVDNDKKFKQKLVLNIEAKDIKDTEKNKKEILGVIIDELSKLNSEYKKLYQTNPEMATPILNLLTKEEFEEYSNKSIKIKYKK